LTLEEIRRQAQTAVQGQARGQTRQGLAEPIISEAWEWLVSVLNPGALERSLRRIEGHFDAILRVQLLHDVREIVLGSLFTDTEFVGNFLVAHPLSQQGEYLFFPSRKSNGLCLVMRQRFAGQMVEELPQELRGNARLSGGCGLGAPDQL
jgi:hypothetical protein